MRKAFHSPLPRVSLFHQLVSPLQTAPSWLPYAMPTAFSPLGAHGAPAPPFVLPSEPSVTDINQPLVVSFAEARLNWGPLTGLLVALSAADGSLHLVKVSSKGIVPTQLAAAGPQQTETRSGFAVTWDTVLGFSRALSEPNSRYVSKAPAV
ncbi:hypothetical protein Vretimale_18580 [Volvox reticuliferus]|uniref:Uncharacterized protein n=1 Tax=Volvox reticuliferus TaxID=1737510 RepID=A0A8J4LZN6_9CHLO|nr:hypothetical protein Vretifemale_17071 [Volvox reticuliferus]GIM15930.1 hypothetical protein Vretimale_18580 [Volvox reticuliferus]